MKYSWRRLGSGARWQRLGWGLGWPLAMAATPYWVGLQGPSICGFLAVTGWPCPLCGGTRACAALVQGDVLLAMTINSGAVLLLAWLCVITLQALGEGVIGAQRLQRWWWWRQSCLIWLASGVLLSWFVMLARWDGS